MGAHGWITIGAHGGPGWISIGAPRWITLGALGVDQLACTRWITMPGHAGSRTGLRDTGERSDYGAEVHGAWSQSVTHPLTNDSRVQKAARRSGTTGLGTVGVEP
jgi:hypothetical protein